MFAAVLHRPVRLDTSYVWVTSQTVYAVFRQLVQLRADHARKHTLLPFVFGITCEVKMSDDSENIFKASGSIKFNLYVSQCKRYFKPARYPSKGSILILFLFVAFVFVVSWPLFAIDSSEHSGLLFMN